MAPKNLKYASLCDIYGGLLSEKQRSAIEMYYCDDLSLAEIAEHMGITRQGVRDQIKHAEEELDRFEEKLLLLDKDELVSEISDIFDALSILIDNSAKDAGQMRSLCKRGKELAGLLIGDTDDLENE